MKILNGYTLDEKQWKACNGGQYNIATKDEKKYYIKRLYFPRYPVSDNFMSEFQHKKIDACNEWLRCRQEIIDALPGSRTGTIVKPIEYFREGSFYYEVSNIIAGTIIPYYEIYKWTKEDRARIMLIVARIFSDLHKKKIVHGNLKPDNILIYQLPGSRNPVVKVIGFENAFFESEPPKIILSETAYQSPEVIHYNQAAAEETTINPYQKDISCKLDVYSLGLIFQLYCTGTLPICGTNLSGRELNGEKSIQIDSKIEFEFRTLIADMLQEDPSKRLSMTAFHQLLMGGSSPGWPSLSLRLKDMATFDLQID